MRTRFLSILTVVAILVGSVSCAGATPTPAATPTEPPPPATATEIAVIPTDTTVPTETATPTEVAPEPTATTEPTAPPEPADAEPTVPAASAAEELPVFVEAQCPFPLPLGQADGETVECGYLVVPENRDDPESRAIRLSVAVFHPEDGAIEPDPVVYLSGGPGGSALELLFLSFERFEPMLEAGRDLIFFDQRGVGTSEPALDCPEFVEMSLDLLDNELDGKELTLEEAGDVLLAELLDCEANLSSSADLTAYNSAASAADVDDLRLALGYAQVNLWGGSYGTRLALEVLRDYPEGIRSAVLDSVYPPDADMYLEGPSNLDRALDTLFDACAADEACDNAYPDLRAMLFDTVNRLNEDPVPLQLTDPLANESYDALLDGDTLLSLMFRLLYQTQVLPSLPQLIHDASQGEYDLLALVWGSLLAEAPAMSRGMSYSVQCNEEIPFSSLEEFEAMIVDYPELAGLYDVSSVGRHTYQVCEDWDSGEADPTANEPVTSDVPALILGGEFDPITPPSWGRRAAETLENSFAFEFPAVGHGASLEPCPQEMMLAFLDDPTTEPDGACMAGMSMVFEVPGGAAEAVELEPFTNEAMGVSGLAPAGWTEAAPGVYNRGQSGLDVAVIVIQAAPGTAEQLLTLISGQLGLDEEPEPVAEHEANGLTWNLYAVGVQGMAVDIGLSESDGLGLVVLLQCEADERDVLYDTVFLPVVDALVPAE